MAMEYTCMSSTSCHHLNQPYALCFVLLRRRLDTNRGLYSGTPYEKATNTADGVLVGPQALVTIVNDLPGPLAPLGRLLLKLTGGLTADGVVAAP